MGIGPFDAFSFPGVYTQTFNEAPSVTAAGALRFPVFIGVADELIPVNNYEMIRGSSSLADNKIVNQVMEQALIHTHILNADKFQAAVNTQASLMTDPTVSHKVRSDAANSLMTHLKQPETTKLKVEIGTKEDDSLKELREAVTELAIAQKTAIQVGVSDAEKIAGAKIIQGESERVD